VSASSIARRYARALLSIGDEDGRFEQYGAEVDRVDAAYAASAELRDVWTNPAYPREERLATLERLVGVLTLSPAVANLMRLFVERRRVAELPMLARTYRSMVDEKAGRVRAVVTSARPLAPAQTAAVQASLAAATGKQVLVESRVDASLIGGVTARVGSTVYDGSVKTQLERLRESLEAA
jgi:F-type H+-transporting ATPase subunit delta